MNQKIKGLYAITPDCDDINLLCLQVEQVLQGGANLVQYRHKTVDHNTRLRTASALLKVCQTYQKPLIINDDWKLCLEINADGVHLGQDDGEITYIRKELGRDKILGISCYQSLERVVLAKNAQADYAALGVCFPSQVKPNNKVVSQTTLTSALKLDIPIVAIGGITLSNSSHLLKLNVSCIAVISDLFLSEDIEQRAGQWVDLFR